jgi:hypothetical protein
VKLGAIVASINDGKITGGMLYNFLLVEGCGEVGDESEWAKCDSTDEPGQQRQQRMLRQYN